MKLGRTKYWLFWPNFYDAEDAHDGAKMGVIACALIAGVTGLMSTYRYYMGGDMPDLLSGFLVLIVFSAIGYGILKMSRVASSIALILLLAEIANKTYISALSGGSIPGMAFISGWYLLQANRAIYWFRREEKKNREKSA